MVARWPVALAKGRGGGPDAAASRKKRGWLFLLVCNPGNLTLSDPGCLVCMVAANGDLLIISLQFTLFLDTI